MNKARQALIRNRRSEKFRRVLLHQEKPILACPYNNGDLVYYKKITDRWMGPGSMIGRENRQVLVKHDGFFASMNPCCLRNLNKGFVTWNKF